MRVRLQFSHFCWRLFWSWRDLLVGKARRNPSRESPRTASLTAAQKAGMPITPRLRRVCEADQTPAQDSRRPSRKVYEEIKDQVAEPLHLSMSVI